MKTFRSLLLSFLTITIIVACGDKKEKKEEGFSYENNTSEEKSETPKNVDDDVANVVITGDDLMKFNKTEIRVKAGQKVRLTLRHIGKLDINMMGHNVVILKIGVNPTEFAAKAATEKDNGYLPIDSQDIIAHTDLIGGGQVTTIEFDAPAAGTYDFLCSFPAHFALMKGKFIVE
jgi:azurin